MLPTAPKCACGHTVGEHKSAGTRWPHPPQFGVCLVAGCGCSSFKEKAA